MFSSFWLIFVHLYQTISSLKPKLILKEVSIPIDKNMATVLNMRGKRWDSSDDEALRRMYDSEELGILPIAKTFGRTAGAVANRLKVLKMIRGDLRTEDYPDHVRGWMEYLGDTDFREAERIAAKPKTSPKRLLDTKSTQHPVDEIAELREEMRARFDRLEGLLMRLPDELTAALADILEE